MGLNEKQREAVLTKDGPVLVSAGAGSGKTTALTYRYAHLLEQKVSPENILMVTFTRKAANEMKQRIKKRLENANNAETWIDTFHRICMRILRDEGYKHIAVPQNFKVCNEYESKNTLKEIITELRLSGGSDNEEDTITNHNISSYIKEMKILLIDHHTFTEEKPFYSCMNWEQASSYMKKLQEEKPVIYNGLKQIYPLYQKRLLEKGLLDFDDILLYCIELFDKNPKIREMYQQKFHYIMVDEFQDTNYMQDILINLLVNPKENICVVGDDFQSIYAFRGSDVKNILDFENRYHNVKVVKLEQNYRSTKRIIDVANTIIKFNTMQTDKVLFTENPLGETIPLVETNSEEAEAEYIAKEIQNLIKSGQYDYKDITVLYRNNHQSSKFSKEFAKNRIPFQISTNVEFLDRPEIRDIFSYLLLVEDPTDLGNFRRVLNKPKRGIGDKSVEMIFDNMEENIYKTLRTQEQNPAYNKKAKEGIREFIEVFKYAYGYWKKVGISAAIERLLSDLNYEERVYGKSFPYEQEEVRENLNSLISLAKEYEKENENPTMSGFKQALEEVFDIETSETSKVTLMTAHKSKGLEYPVVFVAGMDDATFPNEENKTELFEIEEERRLFYVASTRAMKRLYYSYATEKKKRVEGKMETIQTKPSRFLEEIKEQEHIQCSTYQSETVE